MCKNVGDDTALSGCQIAVHITPINIYDNLFKNKSQLFLTRNLFLSQVLLLVGFDGFVALKQIKQNPQGFAARRRQLFILRHNHLSVFVGGIKQMFVFIHVGNAKFAETRLPGAENFTAAAQFQIFFGNQKTVFGFAA